MIFKEIKIKTPREGLSITVYETSYITFKIWTLTPRGQRISNPPQYQIMRPRHIC